MKKLSRLEFFFIDVFSETIFKVILTLAQYYYNVCEPNKWEVMNQ